MLGQGEPFCQVEVTPEKIRTAQGVAAQVSELAILRAVTAVALPAARVNGRDEGLRIEPLQRSWLCNSRDRMMLIQRNARNNASKLGPAALHDAVSLRRIGRAQGRERNPAVPK